MTNINNIKYDQARRGGAIALGPKPQRMPDQVHRVLFLNLIFILYRTRCVGNGRIIAFKYHINKHNYKNTNFVVNNKNIIYFYASTMHNNNRIISLLYNIFTLSFWHTHFKGRSKDMWHGARLSLSLGTLIFPRGPGNDERSSMALGREQHPIFAMQFC